MLRGICSSSTKKAVSPSAIPAADVVVTPFFKIILLTLRAYCQLSPMSVPDVGGVPFSPLVTEKVRIVQGSFHTFKQLPSTLPRQGCPFCVSGPEVVVVIDYLQAEPTELGMAVTAMHFVATRGLLNSSFTLWAFLYQTALIDFLYGL